MEEMDTHIDAKITAKEIERLEDELDLIAYEKAMAEYRANPVTYTMEEMKKELELDD